MEAGGQAKPDYHLGLLRPSHSTVTQQPDPRNPSPSGCKPRGLGRRCLAIRCLPGNLGVRSSSRTPWESQLLGWPREQQDSVPRSPRGLHFLPAAAQYHTPRGPLDSPARHLWKGCSPPYIQIGRKKGSYMTGWREPLNQGQGNRR